MAEKKTAEPVEHTHAAHDVRDGPRPAATGRPAAATS